MGAQQGLLGPSSRALAIWVSQIKHVGPVLWLFAVIFVLFCLCCQSQGAKQHVCLFCADLGNRPARVH